MQQCAAMWSKYVIEYMGRHIMAPTSNLFPTPMIHIQMCAIVLGIPVFISSFLILHFPFPRSEWPLGSGIATPGPIRMAFQNGQQFLWSKPVPISWSNTYFYGQNFCCQNWFFNVQTYKFSWSRNIFVTKFLGQSPVQCQNFMLNPLLFQFYAQLCSIPTAFRGQSRFHGQWQSRPTCTRSQPRLAAYLWCVHWASYNTSPTM